MSHCYQLCDYTGDAMAHLGSVFRKREAHLMDVCDWEGMSDDKWTTMLKVLTLLLLSPI